MEGLAPCRQDQWWPSEALSGSIWEGEQARGCVSLSVFFSCQPGHSLRPPGLGLSHHHLPVWLPLPSFQGLCKSPHIHSLWMHSLLEQRFIEHLLCSRCWTKCLRPQRRTGHSPSARATARAAPLLAVAPFPTVPVWTDEYLREAHGRAPCPTSSFVSQGSENRKEGF